MPGTLPAIGGACLPVPYSLVEKKHVLPWLIVMASIYFLSVSGSPGVLPTTEPWKPSYVVGTQLSTSRNQGLERLFSFFFFASGNVAASGTAGPGHRVEAAVTQGRVSGLGVPGRGSEAAVPEVDWTELLRETSLRRPCPEGPQRTRETPGTQSRVPVGGARGRRAHPAAPAP